MKPIEPVTDLEWVELAPQAPFQQPKRIKGVKGKGLTYERAVGRWLKRENQVGRLPGELRLGTWLRYKDWKGVRYAQPDAHLLARDMVLVMEVKRSWTYRGVQQLELLYAPLLRELYRKPVVKVVVCKFLFDQPCLLLPSLQELLDWPRQETCTFHLLV